MQENGNVIKMTLSVINYSGTDEYICFKYMRHISMTSKIEMSFNYVLIARGNIEHLR